MKLLNVCWRWWINRKLPKEKRLKGVVLEFTLEAFKNTDRVIEILSQGPEYDAKLPEYIGNSLNDILKKYPQGIKKSLYENKLFPIYLEVIDETGTKLFFFDKNVNSCTEAVYFNNED